MTMSMSQSPGFHSSSMYRELDTFWSLSIFGASQRSIEPKYVKILGHTILCDILIYSLNIERNIEWDQNDRNGHLFMYNL